jgi:hypothetical protein
MHLLGQSPKGCWLLTVARFVDEAYLKGPEVVTYASTGRGSLTTQKGTLRVLTTGMDMSVKAYR